MKKADSLVPLGCCSAAVFASSRQPSRLITIAPANCSQCKTYSSLKVQAADSL
jgi:hypothetical protein